MAKLIKYVLLTYLVIALFVGLLLPPIEIISIDNLLLPFVLIALLLNYKSERVFWISGGVVFLFVVTGLLSNFVNGGLTMSELLWNVRWLKLFAVFWTFFYAMSKARSMLEGTMLICFLLLVLVNALQLLNVEFVVDLYSTKSDVSVLYKSTLIDARLGGTFLNPNNNGFIMALFAIYFILSKIQWKFILFAMALILVLLSQSRTVFVAFIFAIGLIVSYRLLRQNKKYFL